MRLWIDTDVGDNPDDTVALWCAARTHGADLVGVSTVGGNAAFARELLPGVDVYDGPPPPEIVASVEVLAGIGPWTHVAALAEADALPRRVVLMGGALGGVTHRGAVQHVEHNVGSDPDAARRLVASVGSLIVVPLDATALLRARPVDEQVLVEHIAPLRSQLDAWRKRNGDLPLVLHDPATVLIALGEPIARMETRRLRVEPDGLMRASIDGPLQHVVAYVDVHATRARVRALVSRG